MTNLLITDLVIANLRLLYLIGELAEVIKDIEFQIKDARNNYKIYHSFPELFKVTAQVLLLALAIMLNSTWSLLPFFLFLGLTLISPDRIYFLIFRDGRGIEYKKKIGDLYRQKKLLVDQAILEFDQNHPDLKE